MKENYEVLNVQGSSLPSVYQLREVNQNPQLIIDNQFVEIEHMISNVVSSILVFIKRYTSTQEYFIVGDKHIFNLLECNKLIPKSWQATERVIIFSPTYDDLIRGIKFNGTMWEEVFFSPTDNFSGNMYLAVFNNVPA